MHSLIVSPVNMRIRESPQSISRQFTLNNCRGNTKNPIMTTQCAVCGVAASLKCSGCQGIVYCGKEHQKAHWKTHKKTCVAIQVGNSSPFDKFNFYHSNPSSCTMTLVWVVTIEPHGTSEPGNWSCARSRWSWALKLTVFQFAWAAIATSSFP